MLTLAIGLGVLAIMIVGERLSPRIPGALIGLGGATALVAVFGLESRGVSALGEVAGALPRFKLPDVSLDDLTRISAARLHRRCRRDGADGGDDARLSRPRAGSPTSIAIFSASARPARWPV